MRVWRWCVGSVLRMALGIAVGTTVGCVSGDLSPIQGDAGNNPQGDGGDPGAAGEPCKLGTSVLGQCVLAK
jgi:hypothetical protein